MSAGNPGGPRIDPVVPVDHGPKNRMPWGYMQWLCSGTLFADAQQTFGYVEIDPGRKNPRHLHPNSDEVLYLLEGELDHSLGDAVYHLEAGMSIHIPMSVAHDAVNRGTGVARMLVAYPTADRQVVMCEEGQD
jgi:quercetin dioxygenase-like cupin family protein